MLYTISVWDLAGVHQNFQEARRRLLDGNPETTNKISSRLVGCQSITRLVKTPGDLQGWCFWRCASSRSDGGARRKITKRPWDCFYKKRQFQIVAAPRHTLEATDWSLILFNVVWCEHWVHVVSCFHNSLRPADPREQWNVKLDKLSKSTPHLCEKDSEKLLSRFIVRGMRSLNPGWILQPRRIQFYCTC